MRQTRHQGRKRSAQLRQWQCLVALCREILEAASHETVRSRHDEIRQACQAACSLCASIWPAQANDMALYTFSLCWGIAR